MSYTRNLLFVLALASSSLARAGVIVVADDGSGQFPDLPAAIAAAADGDIVLVKSGRYTGFTINNKSLDIVAEQGAAAILRSQVSIVQLNSTRSVTLTGLILRGPINTPPNALPALKLMNNLGSVRIQGCEITGRGGPLCQTDSYGAAGVEVVSCQDVCFARCGITGGAAGDFGPVGHGGYGGDGLSAWNSRIAIYDCTIVAGLGASSASECGGAPNGGFAGAGGNAVRFLWSPNNFISRTFLLGGDCGASSVPSCPGAGIFLYGNSTVTTLQSPAAHGNPVPGGTSACTPVDVLVSPGTTYSPIAGDGRVLTSKRIVREGAILRIEFRGQPGDQVELEFGDRGGHVASNAWRGVNLVRGDSLMPLLQAGVIDANGELSLTWTIPDLGPGVRGRRLFLQALFHDASGTTTYSAPATVVVVDSTL